MCHNENVMPTLLVVIGPTASGKTAYSIRLANELGNAEIVNADSRQLYKYLNIGTAKITAEEMADIPHHLLDVLDPSEEVTVGWYQKVATQVIEEIQARGNTPILVGGSMLYVSSIIDNLSLAPVADQKLRQKLLDEYDIDDGNTLYKRLQELDPESARVIHQNNKPHLVRAVEICELMNQPKSHAIPETQRRGGEAIDGKYDVQIFGMEWERPKLVERINKRTKLMFDQGWVDEVQSLLDKGYGPEAPAMKSHGYKEIMRHLTTGEPSSLKELQEVIAAKSRQYAKRQMTWWRTDQRIHWVHPDS